MPTVRQRMRRATYTDLEPEAQQKLIDTAKMFRPIKSRGFGIDPYAALLWFLKTGMHPTVLRDPDKHKLEVIIPPEDDPEPWPLVRWSRPKKEGIEARTYIRLETSDRAWVGTFYEWLKTNPRSPETYRRLFLDLGLTAGVGVVTTRTLRHTFITNMFARGYNIAEVMLKANINERQAIVYARKHARATDTKTGEVGVMHPDVHL
jgi:integrase